MPESTAVAHNPHIVGLRIQTARKARGMSQQDVATALGISRPTYIAVEKGSRPATPAELIRLAELFQTSVHELLRQSPPVGDFVPHFRTAAGSRFEMDGLAEATARLQVMCGHYVELEHITHSALSSDFPNVYSVGKRGVEDAAAEIADAERRRLDLGDGPIGSLRRVLETDVGLRVFLLPLPSRVAGLFVYDTNLGGCIGIQIQHPVTRREWSLAHEYAHFLVHRFEPEVTILRTSARSTAKERFADAFAQSFLMPEYGLRRRFNDVRQASEAMTVGSLVTLADLYNVSFQAMCRRLEDLRLIQPGTWERLQERGFKVNQAREHLGVATESEESPFPDRYITLAVQAYEDESITEGELMRFLDMDRQGARETVRRVQQTVDVSRDGELRHLTLDLAEPLAA